MDEKNKGKENKIEKKGIITRPTVDKPRGTSKPTGDKQPKEDKPEQSNTNKESKK